MVGERFWMGFFVWVVDLGLSRQRASRRYRSTSPIMRAGAFKFDWGER